MHGEALIDGSLVELGVLRSLRSVPDPFDRFGRRAENVMPALMLEMWAQGMRGLERSSKALADIECDWTKERMVIDSSD